MSMTTMVSMIQSRHTMSIILPPYNDEDDIHAVHEVQYVHDGRDVHQQWHLQFYDVHKVNDVNDIRTVTYEACYLHNVHGVLGFVFK